MEVYNTQLHSIFGKWWQPIRKWFYPAWLLYELSIRFYAYAIDVYQYFMHQQDSLDAQADATASHILAISSGVATWTICTAFLSVPAGFVLYKFFELENITETQFEQKVKKYF